MSGPSALQGLPAYPNQADSFFLLVQDPRAEGAYGRICHHSPVSCALSDERGFVASTRIVDSSCNRLLLAFPVISGHCARTDSPTLPEPLRHDEPCER